MVQSRSASHAKEYFQESLSKSDYYTNDQELAGFWEGKLAERLGIHGETTKEAFYALCENRHPVTGGALTPRTRDVRTAGYDINFHCPKSVSILHAFAKDDHILEAFRQSVTETMQEIEKDMEVRIRKNSAFDHAPAQELVWGHFVHQTARPVEGALPDPHLHSHCFVFNATWDEKENCIKAGMFREVNRNMPYYTAHFHKVLSDRLQDLGYTIRRTEKAFEIEGVPKHALDLFSKRTDEIGRAAREKGITNPEELAELGARTRAKKMKGHSMDELRQEWRSQIHALEASSPSQTDVAVRFDRQGVPFTMAASECVSHAILHRFERASVNPARRILETAFRQSIGTNARIEDIIRSFRDDRRIIHIKEKGRQLCTTREVLNEERQMVELARGGKGKMFPLYKTCPPLKASGQQATAIENVLTTVNQVSIVRGAAGAGKTTLMKEAVELIEAAGKKVTVIAPSSQASRGVLRQEGFEGAETVARFLSDKDMQDSIKGQVLWVDEAGLLGTKDTLQILRIANQHDARVIFGGDTRQHSSVVRGDALRILNTVAGIQASEVSKIYRQRNEEYKAAVSNLAEGNVEQAFSRLDKMGCIKSVDPMKPTGDMVEDYVGVMKKGKSALLISPTHAQGEEATAGIRKRLRQEGLIGKYEKSVPQLRNLNLTEAEKSDPRNILPGQFLQFNQNVKGIKRGSLWLVIEDEDGCRQIMGARGEIRAIPANKSDRYDVFVQRELMLSKHDKVMVTRGAFDNNNKRLENGDMLEVMGIKNGKLNLRNEKSDTLYTVPQDFGHLRHAYCITSHASQGKTVDEVFIYQPAATFAATDAKQFYVSVSRGRDQAHIYTDDKEELLQHASDQGERQSALELISKDRLHKDALLQQQITTIEEQSRAEIDRDLKQIDHGIDR